MPNKFLGIGLAADLGSNTPDWRRYVNAPRGAPHVDYLNIAATWDQVPKIRHHLGRLVEDRYPFVVHPINFNLALRHAEPEEIVNGVRELVELTNAHWIGHDVGLWMWGDQYLGEFLVPPILDDEGVVDAADKLRYLSNLFGRPYLFENPPVNFSVESMHMLEFMTAVSEKSGCELILDVGHLLGYQCATGRSLDDMPLDRFAWHRVGEVHLAGLMRRVSGGYETLYDHHGYAIPEESWRFLSDNLHKMTNLRGITLEQEFCADRLVDEHIRRLREILSAEGLS